MSSGAGAGAGAGARGGDGGGAVRCDAIRAALTAGGFGAVRVARDGLCEVLAVAASGGAPRGRGGYLPRDWAVAAYVATSSGVASGGVAPHAAIEVEEVLDALVGGGVLRERALYVAALDAGRAGAATALALHSLAAPVIAVPPARLALFARFQVPPAWDVATYAAVARLEDFLRSCRSGACAARAPAEYDPSVLNVAALTTWALVQPACANAARGAYASVATFERIAKTIAWLQVIYLLILEVGQYPPEIADRSLNLYGNPLFRPCEECLADAKSFVEHCGLQADPNLVEDTLALLVCYAGRLTPVQRKPWAREISEPLWGLLQLLHPPGEDLMHSVDLFTRLDRLKVRENAPCPWTAARIAATCLRGLPACARMDPDGHKWDIAMALANIGGFTAALGHASNPPLAVNKDVYKAAVRNMLFRSGAAFGVAVNSCGPGVKVLTQLQRSKRCSGIASVCLFNEHSGIVSPQETYAFLKKTGLSEENLANIARLHLETFTECIEGAHVAFVAQIPIPPEYITLCCSCTAWRRSRRERRRLVLMQWSPPKANEPGEMSGCTGQDLEGNLGDEAGVEGEVRAGANEVAHESYIPGVIRAAGAPILEGFNQPTTQELAGEQRNALPVNEGGLPQYTPPPVSTIPSLPGYPPIPSLGESEWLDRRASGEPALPPVRVAAHATAAGGHEEIGGEHRETMAEELFRELTRAPVPEAVHASCAMGPLGDPGPDLYRYIVVEAGRMEHLLFSGSMELFDGTDTWQCEGCGGRWGVIPIPDSMEQIEVQIDQVLNAEAAASRLSLGIHGAHDIFEVPM